MISQDRIILMSKAAMLEQNNSKEMGTNHYYRKEYVVSHFLLTWLYVTIVYVALAMCIGVLFIEEFPKEAQNTDWIYVLMTAFMIYVIVVFIYALLCLVIYSLRYGRSIQTVKKYNAIIKQISILDSEEEEVNQPLRIENTSSKKIKKKSGKNTKGGK